MKSLPKFNASRRPIPASLRANDSYTFLMKELERVDQKIYEPLTGTDWPRDMPVITGGGLTESIVAVDVTYGSIGRDQNNLIFDATNDIPVIQADLSQSIARCFNFAEYLSFSVLEREKMRSVGRDPEAFLNKGIRLHCDKIIDQNVYTGFTRVSSTGLINNPRIMRVSSPATGTGNSSKWADKTADQILDDINTLIAGVWKVCDCSSDALPDHILVPVEPDVVIIRAVICFGIPVFINFRILAFFIAIILFRGFSHFRLLPGFSHCESIGKIRVLFRVVSLIPGFIIVQVIVIQVFTFFHCLQHYYSPQSACVKSW